MVVFLNSQPLLFGPSLLRSRPGNLRAPLFAQLRGPRLAALAPKFDSRLVLAVVVGGFLDLPRGDLGHGDCGSDHVGGSLLAFGAFRRE